jgi:hypothetical protein
VVVLYNGMPPVGMLPVGMPPVGMPRETGLDLPRAYSWQGLLPLHLTIPNQQARD